MKTGVLLVNLGTPKSPLPCDVYRYLIEFLTDARVMDLPWLKRQLLVRGVIVPFRYRQSAKAYQQIWTDKGSPLLIHGKNLVDGLSHALGSDFVVGLGMRYQEPSLEKIVAQFMQEDLKHLIILPLFPQYASATTGSVHECVQKIIRRYSVIPKLTFIDQFANDPGMVSAFCSRAKEYPFENYDHFVFSFHGLPQRQLQTVDKHNRCLKSQECCDSLCEQNRSCYSAQCHSTAFAIAEKLNISDKNYTICFQSRLGKEPWMQPYTSDVIKRLAKEGKKRVLVFCPSFVCDCLETIYEIGVEYAQEFQHAGGVQLDLVKGLNDHPDWVKALKQIIMKSAG